MEFLSFQSPLIQKSFLYSQEQENSTVKKCINKAEKIFENKQSSSTSSVPSPSPPSLTMSGCANNTVETLANQQPQTKSEQALEETKKTQTC